MLVVRLEMWPMGDATKAREIGRTYIYNEGGSTVLGDYGVRVCHEGQLGFEPWMNHVSKAFARSAKVLKYPRLSLDVWRLVLRSLAAAFPEEP
jgi:hypothetical protein